MSVTARRFSGVATTQYSASGFTHRHTLEGTVHGVVVYTSACRGEWERRRWTAGLEDCLRSKVRKTLSLRWFGLYLRVMPPLRSDSSSASARAVCDLGDQYTGF